MKEIIKSWLRRAFFDKDRFWRGLVKACFTHSSVRVWVIWLFDLKKDTSLSYVLCSILCRYWYIIIMFGAWECRNQRPKDDDLVFEFMAQHYKIDFSHGNLAEEDNITQPDVVQGTPKGYIMTSLAERETLQKLYLSLQGHKVEITPVVSKKSTE